ncbi:DUF4381 domain-containing protein [Dyella jejuensis]|uniref:DUF4381 domain-containing protein n=1 Tax=Dyella jejuensis TaxID=1432009 RepID=A0ABW8JMR7_9GAMM
MNGLFPQAPAQLALRDIHLPPAPSWWPPAPGWWVSCGVLCVALALASLAYRRRRRRRRWREQVLAEIPQLAMRHAGDDAAYATSLHQLLRRAARRYATDAHHVQGASWRQVLAQVPVDTATLDTLMALETRMYRPQADLDRQAAQAAVHRWLQAALRSPKMAAGEQGHA